MAAVKRKAETENDDTSSNKLLKGNVDDSNLHFFLHWCTEGKMWINDKVKVSKNGSCANYGMLATDLINQGECLFEIPRSLLLSPATSNISDLLDGEIDDISSASGWVPLMLTLLHEYSNPDSKWQPYFKVVADMGNLSQGLPMFWTASEIAEELAGTGLPKLVEEDLKNMSEEFNTIAVPFMKKHREHFPEQCFDLELYKKLAALVMSYSFTEPIRDDEESDDSDEEETKSPPMMVPMADILNHIAKNNAHLDYGKESLKMIATVPIEKGDEVFNTYGVLSNSELLHMYGFAEQYPNNINDTVEIDMSTFYKVAEERCKEVDQDLLVKKWDFLKSTDVVRDDGTFVLGLKGVLTPEDLHQTLQVLTMKADEFRRQTKNSGWLSDDEDNEDVEALATNQFQKLAESSKNLLIWSCEEALKSYNTSMEKEEKNVQSDVLSTLTKRQQFCVHVRYGQLKLLHELIRMIS